MKGASEGGSSEAGSSPNAVQARLELRSGFRYRVTEVWWDFTEGRSPVTV